MFAFELTTLLLGVTPLPGVPNAFPVHNTMATTAKAATTFLTMRNLPFRPVGLFASGG